MSEKNNVAQHYKRKQLESVSPGRLIVMLYDKAIEHLDNAAEAFKEKKPENIEKYHNALVTCQNIITELTVALDMEKGGEIAQNLYRLYDFMTFRLIDANVKKDVKAISEVKELLLTLKAAWVEIQDVPLPEEHEKESNSGINIKG